MKIFQLTQDDFDRLFLTLDQNPEQSEGSMHHMGDAERSAYREAHRYYNHRLRRWVAEVTK